MNPIQVIDIYFIPIMKFISINPAKKIVKLIEYSIVNQNLQLVCYQMKQAKNNHQLTKREMKNMLQNEQQLQKWELGYIDTLMPHLQNILQTALRQEENQLNSRDQLIFDLKEQNNQLQQRYQDVLEKFQCLISENNQLKINWNHSKHALRQLQRKELLLNKQINQLNHIITQKEAIIKYLEQKQEEKAQLSFNNSYNENQSFYSNTTNHFKSSLPLDKLQVPQSKEARFYDFMPSTTRSINSTQRESMIFQNYAQPQQLKNTHSKASKQNRQLFARHSNLNERSFQASKNLSRNQSSFVLNNCKKTYDYNFWKSRDEKNPKQYNRKDSLNSFSFYNRPNLASKHKLEK